MHSEGHHKPLAAHCNGTLHHITALRSVCVAWTRLTEKCV